MSKVAIVFFWLGLVAGRAVGAGDVGAECKALEQRIALLEAQAREPRSAQDQDRIRAEHRAARDRQFELRCR